jgi:hypothetical protein
LSILAFWVSNDTINGMKILGKIFGSSARVKLLRLFLFNPDQAYELSDAVQHVKVDKSKVRNELATLNRAGFIKRRSFYKQAVKKKAKTRAGSITLRESKHEMKKKRVYGWILDQKFPYLDAFQKFLINSTQFKDKDILKRLSKAGKLKLLVITGVFMRNLDSRLDVLVVGDRIRKPLLESGIKSMEADLGKELRYAVFSVNDFQYRLRLYDKLVRDVFDYPHRKIIDRIGIEFHPRSETSAINTPVNINQL